MLSQTNCAILGKSHDLSLRLRLPLHNILLIIALKLLNVILTCFFLSPSCLGTASQTCICLDTCAVVGAVFGCGDQDDDIWCQTLIAAFGNTLVVFLGLVLTLSVL